MTRSEFLEQIATLSPARINSAASDFPIPFVAPVTMTLNAAGEVFIERLAWLSGTFLIGCLILVLLARYLTPKVAVFGKFILKGNEQDGYVAVENLKSLPKKGANGKAATTLRPAGKVVIDDILYDAMSAGFLIEKGESITVVGIDGGTLLVTKHKDI